MLAILATTFPFFALVLCGYIAVRRHMLPQLAIPGMNGFVLYFALPCLLYRFGSGTPLAQLLDPGVFAGYLLACRWSAWLRRIARIILVSTALSVPSFSGLVALLI